jgi:hypothetical protein
MLSEVPSTVPSKVESSLVISSEFDVVSSPTCDTQTLASQVSPPKHWPALQAQSSSPRLQSLPGSPSQPPKRMPSKHA